jgi:UDP-N-acetylmuramoylalanine--D-glutamate ligase
VVLNVSANHLDRHGTLENYAGAKENIFRNQGRKETLILNAGDARVKMMESKAHSRVIFYGCEELPEGVCLDGTRVIRKKGGKKKELFDTRSFHLKGEHNLENLMACAAVADLLRVPKKKIQVSLEGFKTLEHRIEPVGELRGVRFINDAKSTTVESTRRAILASEGRLILIAGGRDKGLSYGDLEPLLIERVKAVVLYGEAREKMAASWERFGSIRKEANFRQAVRLAFEGAEPGDSILLSPMGTSFDQFSSFEQRGEAFKHVFQELVKEKGETRP